MQYPADLEQNFLDRSKSTEVDKVNLPLMLPQQKAKAKE